MWQYDGNIPVWNNIWLLFITSKYKKITIMKNNTIKLQSLFILLLAGIGMAFTSCSKDNNAGDTPSAHIRVINAFEGSASQDLYLDNTKITTSAVAYANFTGYLSALAGSHTAKFSNSGSATANVSLSLTLQPSNYYSIYYTSNDTIKTAFVTHDDITAPAAGKAKVRFVQLSAATASAVDFGITASTKLVTNLARQVVSDYYQVDANTSFSLYATGSETVLLSIPTSVQAGKTYTVYISGATALSLSAHVITED
jgi:hypothetical protein